MDVFLIVCEGSEWGRNQRGGGKTSGQEEKDGRNKRKRYQFARE